MLTHEEWRRLSPEERAALRAAKHARRAEEAARDAEAQMINGPRVPWQSLQRGTFWDRTLTHEINLSGLYSGACFITLTGPSINTLDLEPLKRSGAMLLGVNNSIGTIKPHIWTYVDRAYRFHDAIWRDPTVTKIVPAQHLVKWQLKEWDAVEEKPVLWSKENGEPVRPYDCPGVIACRRNAWFEPETWLSEPSLNWGNSLKSHEKNGWPHKLDTMFMVINLAYALGFRLAFLLGCDFTMDKAKPYSTDEVKDPGAVQACNEGYHKMDLMFQELDPCLQKAGYHVFNCQEVSGLTAFRYLPYNEAVDMALGGMPAEPLNCKGWYNL